MTDLLVATGVRKVYRTGSGEVPALVDLDLRVARGELVAVMGPSGSGKTTLLNCLSGLDDIDGGTVVVDGHDLFAMRDAERTEHRAKAMGFVFQAFNLIPVFTAAENVELPLLLCGVRAGEARDRERRRTIGVLRALGFRARTVRRSFLAESSLVAAEGILSGAVLAVGTCLHRRQCRPRGPSAGTARSRARSS
jgi:putative ABC transport system ATP-binding protein